MAANNYSDLSPEYWSGKVLLARTSAQVVAPTVTAPLESEITDGDTVNFPVFSAFSTGNANNDGTENTLAARSFSTQQLVIDQSKYVGAHYTDKELKQIAKSARYEDNEQFLMGQALMEDIETAVLTQMVTDGTNTGSGSLDADVLRDFNRRWDGLGVPNEDRWVVVDEYGKEDITAISQFTNINEGGTEAQALLRNGQVGKNYLGNFFGINVIWTPLLPTTGGSPDNPQAIAYTTNSFGLAVQKEVDMKIQPMAAKGGTDAVAYSLYGVKTLRSSEIFTYTVTP